MALQQKRPFFHTIPSCSLELSVDTLKQIFPVRWFQDKQNCLSCANDVDYTPPFRWALYGNLTAFLWASFDKFPNFQFLKCRKLTKFRGWRQGTVYKRVSGKIFSPNVEYCANISVFFFKQSTNPSFQLVQVYHRKAVAQCSFFFNPNECSPLQRAFFGLNCYHGIIGLELCSLIYFWSVCMTKYRVCQSVTIFFRPSVFHSERFWYLH